MHTGTDSTTERKEIGRREYMPHQKRRKDIGTGIAIVIEEKAGKVPVASFILLKYFANDSQILKITILPKHTESNPLDLWFQTDTEREETETLTGEGPIVAVIVIVIGM